MTAKFDVFLSYSSVDKPWAIKLKDDLLSYKVSVWLDKDEIRPGDLFAEALEQALDNCRAVALIVSPEAISSGWVKEEYYRALSLAKTKRTSVQIIPVILREVELPGFLQSRSWVDFQDERDYVQSVWKLVWGITGAKPAQILELSAPDPFSDAPGKPQKGDKEVQRVTSTTPTIDSDHRTKTPKRVRNPFHYGGPVLPEDFVGHQEAVDFCHDQLSKQRRTNIAVNGERRIGKTSLLHYLKHAAQEDWGQHVICLFLDIGIFSKPFKPILFWQEILDLLYIELEPDSPIAIQITDLQSQSTLTNRDFRRLLNNFQQQHPQRSIILLLDEFELIFEADAPADILISLRSLTSSLSGKFTLVTATRDSLSQVCQEVAKIKDFEFHSNFVPYQLERFDQKETYYVVQTLLTKTGVEFTPEELNYIWELSRDKMQAAPPIFVQVAASLIFEHKQKSMLPLDYPDLSRRFEEQTRLYRPVLQDSPEEPPQIGVSEKQSNAQKFNLKKIRTLLIEGFADAELRRLCYDEPDFREVYEQLSEGMGKDQVIDKLIEYADRRDLIERLLALTKEQNPERYKKHQPYDNLTDSPTRSSGNHGKSQSAYRSS